MILRATIPLALGLALAGPGSPAAGADRGLRIRPIETRVLEAVQERRVAVGVPPLARRPALDRVARERAEEVAALPAGRRLATPWYVERALTRVGVENWLLAYQRLAVVTGERPVERLVEQWSRLPEAWSHAMQPETSAVGVGGVHAADGTFVFAAVLLVELHWPEDLHELERAVVEAINDVRREHGRTPLREDPRLSAVARAHSRGMRDRAFFDHRDPAGTTAADRVLAAGVPFQRVAENLSFTQRVRDPVRRAVDNWLGSPGHRENLLGTTFRDTGVGVAVSDAGGVWFTQVFVEPPPGAVPPDAATDGR